MTRQYSRITGTGSYLPPRRLSNADLVAELAAKGVETSDEWIVERTGIRARHFAAPDVACSDLALHAAQNALQAAGVEAKDIDLIIVATSTPDMVFPSSACILQNKLGIAGCPAFDVQAVCSGFVYALTVADAMIRTGTATKALVVSAKASFGPSLISWPTFSPRASEASCRVWATTGWSPQASSMPTDWEPWPGNTNAKLFMKFMSQICC